MDDQRTMNRRTHGVRKNLGDLVHDAVTLAELQVELLKVDMRDARRGVVLALGLIGTGAVLALGTIPILLSSAAHALILHANWSAPLAYLVVGGVAAFVAGGLVWIGVSRAAGAVGTVQRSKAEFAETLRWFKGSLRQAGRSEEDTELDNELWASRSRV